MDPVAQRRSLLEQHQGLRADTSYAAEAVQAVFQQREPAPQAPVDLSLAEKRLRQALEARDEARRKEQQERRHQTESERVRGHSRLQRDLRLQTEVRMVMIKRHLAHTVVEWNLQRTCRRCGLPFCLVDSIGRWQCR